MNARTGISAIVGLLVVVGLGLAVWYVGFCRFYVRVGQMAIITAKNGDPMPPGQILAKPGQQGIWEEPLGEGRYFLNPYAYEWQIVPALTIPAGKVGVVTAKGGTDLPEGEFLAEPGQKGIWRRVLGPGTYRLNPEGYNISLVDAVNIPIGYVGVMTSLAGTKAPDGQFATANQKGVRRDILHPGLYYINPNAFKIDVLEVGLNQVSLSGGTGGQMLTKSKVEVQNRAMQNLATNVIATQQARRLDYIADKVKDMESSLSNAVSWDSSSEAPGGNNRASRGRNANSYEEIQAVRENVQANMAQGNTSLDQVAQMQQTISTYGLAQYVEFPSRDGFEIRLDMTVEFELMPDKVADVFLHYGDLPAMVDKIIMPQIQSVSRLKGSSYRAQDFIVGEGREKFQKELRESLAAVLGEKDIVVHNSLIRHVEVPDDILLPIQQSSLAIEQNLTNIARQNTARKLAELNTAQALIEQRRQEVAQETEKLVAELNAEQEKAVAEIQANTERDVAVIAQETAAMRAASARTLGEARARITTLVDGERAKGFESKVKALGSSEAYTMLQFSEQLNPAIKLQVIHAGPGTLWTDLNNATNLADLAGAKTLSTPASAATSERGK